MRLGDAPPAPMSAADAVAGIQSLPAGGSDGGKMTKAEEAAQAQVYMGSNRVRAPFEGKEMPDPGGGSGRVRLKGARVKVDKVLTVGEAVGKWFEWTDSQRAAYARQAFALGYIDDPGDLRKAQDVWAWSVQQASDHYTAAGTKVTPDDILNTYMHGGSGGGVNKNANKTLTVKRRVVDVSNPTEVQAMIEQAFRQATGRAPDEAEIRTMVRTIQGQQRSNPVLQTETTKYDAEGNPIDITRSSAGGIDPGVVMNDQMKVDPEAAAYQGATTYFSALQSVLGAGV